MNKCVEYAGFCLQGPVRENNEDNLLWEGKYLPRDHVDQTIKNTIAIEEGMTGGGWFAVFDGMGGEALGETASYISARTMSREIVLPTRTMSREMVLPGGTALVDDSEDDTKILTRKMNQAVCSFAKKYGVKAMGTTVAAVRFWGDKVIGFNVGDSRCYRFSKEGLKQLSVDHVQMNPFNRKNCLNQAIGIPESEFIICPDSFEFPQKIGDIYMLCTDGAYSAISNRKLVDILGYEDVSLEEKCQMIRNLIASEQGKDNRTIILMQLKSM